MSDSELQEKEQDAVLDDTAMDFSPEEQDEFDRRSEAAKKGAQKRADNAAAAKLVGARTSSKAVSVVNDVSVKAASNKVMSY